MNIFSHLSRRSKILKENIGFNSGMKELLSSDFKGVKDILDLPIETKESEWRTLEEFEKTSIERTFSFKDYDRLIFFINEFLNISKGMFHYPEINISNLDVSVSLYTRNINDISPLDIKLSKIANEIFEDIKFIQEF